jgi:hypothetical protein
MVGGSGLFQPQSPETPTHNSSDNPQIGFDVVEVCDSTAALPHLELSWNTGTSSAGSNSPSIRRAFSQHVDTTSRSSKDLWTQTSDNKPNWGEPSMKYQENNRRLIGRSHPSHTISVNLSERQGASEPTVMVEMGTTGTTVPQNCRHLLQGAPRRFTPRLIEISRGSFQKGEPTFALVVNGEWEQMLKRISHLCRTRLSWLPSGSSPSSVEASSKTSKRLSLDTGPGPRNERDIYQLLTIASSMIGSRGAGIHSNPTPRVQPRKSVIQLRVKGRCRRSCDEKLLRYLLSLAAYSAEKQLRDQALAAFPNEQVHQSISHFAIDNEEDFDCEEPGAEVIPWDATEELEPFRRQSTADLPLELEEMRRYKREAETRNCDKERDAARLRSPPPVMAMRQGLSNTDRTLDISTVDGSQSEREAGMTRISRPSMLGGDLIFPLSLSPQATMHETVQIVQIPVPCPANEIERKKCAGLWGVSPNANNNKNHHHHHQDRGDGLWMGTCRTKRLDQPPPKILEMPPSDIDGESYMNLGPVASTNQSSQFLGPPAPDLHSNRTAKTLYMEEEIDREYHDGFVTQVYNYLSLGYPSTARDYDHELGHVAGIPIDDLRRDDLYTDAKGYVKAPEGAGVSEQHMPHGKCMRWMALRLYIRKWAREQSARVMDVNATEAWGVSERKGSWAV